MRAFQITDFNTLPALAELPDRAPAKGECSVDIEACGLNFADLLMAEGRYQDTPKPPFTLGMEVCGRIRALGPDTTGPAPGTRVAVFGGQGGLAERGCFPVHNCLPISDQMPASIAAGFQIAYGTSHLALTRRARLKPGERLLVLGAAGGVGLTAVEIGKTLGAEVIAVARGPEKLGVARNAGADHCIDAEEDLTSRVKALGGADVVYDAVGGSAFTSALRATNREGRILAIGFASGDVPQIPANHLLVKNVDVLGFYWGGYFKFNPEALTASLAELLQLYEAGRIHPHVSHTLPLVRAAEGLELLRSRESTGKVVITI